MLFAFLVAIVQGFSMVYCLFSYSQQFGLYRAKRKSRNQGVFTILSATVQPSFLCTFPSFLMYITFFYQIPFFQPSFFCIFPSFFILLSYSLLSTFSFYLFRSFLHLLHYYLVLSHLQCTITWVMPNYFDFTQQEHLVCDQMMQGKVFDFLFNKAYVSKSSPYHRQHIAYGYLTSSTELWPFLTFSND